GRRSLDELVEIGRQRVQRAHHVLDRQVPRRAREVARWYFRHDVVVLFQQDANLATEVGRELRPDAVAARVVPVDPHLVDAAAKPVSLLAMRSYHADTGVRAHGDHRGMTRVRGGRETHLVLRGGRAADGADLAVGPRLPGNPLDRVVAVLERAAE